MGWVGGRKVGGENLHDPLEMGSEKKERLQQTFSAKLGLKLEDWIWRNRRGEDLKSYHLLPWHEWALA